MECGEVRNSTKICS